MGINGANHVNSEDKSKGVVTAGNFLSNTARHFVEQQNCVTKTEYKNPRVQRVS